MAMTRARPNGLRAATARATGPAAALHRHDPRIYGGRLTPTDRGGTPAYPVPPSADADAALRGRSHISVAGVFSFGVFRNQSHISGES
jgi:hypothetical protein